MVLLLWSPMLQALGGPGGPNEPNDDPRTPRELLAAEVERLRPLGPKAWAALLEKGLEEEPWRIGDAWGLAAAARLLGAESDQRWLELLERAWRSQQREFNPMEASWSALRTELEASWVRVRFGESSAEELVGWLVGETSREPFRALARAQAVTWGITVKRFEPALLELSRSRDPEIRLLVIVAMDAARPECPEAARERLLEALLDGDARVRDAVKRVVVDHPAGGETLVPALARSATDPSLPAVVRDAAHRGLRVRGFDLVREGQTWRVVARPPDPVPSWAELMAMSEGPGRVSVARALWLRPDLNGRQKLEYAELIRQELLARGWAPDLKALLTDEHDDVRALLLWSLRDVSTDGVEDLIVGLLADTSIRVRNHAASEIRRRIPGSSGYREALTRFLARASLDPDARTRAEALLATGTSTPKGLR